MAAIERVRIMVVGDSGVGKTSFVHLAALNEVLRSASWTIGCSVEVKLHEYKEGTPSQKTFFVELWDVGGNRNHRNTRGVFYNPTHGIILVHDLTNKKSQVNLDEWVEEILDRDPDSMSFHSRITGQMDMENSLGISKIPMLVVGTKVDLADENKHGKEQQFPASSQIASRFGADEIVVDCTSERYLAPGTSNAVVLSRFYDRVIERRFYSKDPSMYGSSMSTSGVTSPIYSSKFYSPTHRD